jgi:hypothetical protein
MVQYFVHILWKLHLLNKIKGLKGYEVKRVCENLIAENPKIKKNNYF